MLFLFVLLSIFVLCRAQDCSATKLCATGCCSQFGFCGTTEAHCGTGCQSTCDFKLGCDAQNPCKDGTCCSKFGFCGLGPQYCAADVCVANCNAKSYCDPGYGPEYSEIGECPLRVCCSKWGFCGLTAEFCGDKKVKRPACNADDIPIRRVVGYYEGWASRRGCMSYQPGDIRPGVYTHLNFAFASIDPVTFHIRPADPGDVALYKQLTDLKKTDPNLKVYIAIGGWDFNEPWNPTATTFSDIAASEANQRVFFASLISFMSTYGFDGVDIDWEYPAADDRAGRPADFENFPNFMRNLKNALDFSSGGRNGLTLTLPVAYWYLRHFDIRKLENYVEFFNIMSYDLHGTWDEGKNWTQPWLNSHTNLTEITEYLDLLWRNDIKPEKVVLGMAFYSRTFGLANPACTAAGGNCYFHGGGAPGRCSNNVGTLMGAEVKEILDQNGIQATLDTAAAVKIFTHNGNWITYDDVDTFKLKVRFAKSQCLGGVMVWAVSQDKGTLYSENLQEATGYVSPGITFDITKHQVQGDPDSRIYRPQCRWTRCGEDCGSGFYPVFRTDGDRHSNTEYMMDNTNCRDGAHSTLCCPAYGPYTKCGWFDFNNGRCGGGCPSGSTLVGSTRIACNNGRPQAACCTTRDLDQWGQDHGEIPDVALYNDCHWEGFNGPYNCGPRETSKCGDASNPIVASRMGAGGDFCDVNGRVLYCCNPPTDVKKWTNCYWQSPNPDSSGHCNPGCPYPEVRVAMEDVPPRCSKGGLAFCCTPVYKSEAITEHDLEVLYETAMDVFMEDPHCTSTLGLKVRDVVFAANTTDLIDPQGGDLEEDISDDELVRRSWDDLKRRQPGQLMDRRQAQQLQVQMYRRHVARNFPPLLAQSVRRIMNTAYQRRRARLAAYNHLNADAVQRYGDGFPSSDRDVVMRDAACDPDELAEVAEETEEFTQPLACGFIWRYDPEFNDDFDDGSSENDGHPNKRRRRRRRGHLKRRIATPLPEPVPEPDADGNWPEVAEDGTVYPYDEIYHELFGRATGASRGYTVNAKKNDNAYAGPTFTVRSSPYPNGNDGDELALRNGDQHRYLVTSNGCGAADYTLLTNAAKSAAAGKWVSEHILELQAFPRFLESVISGRYLRPIPLAQVPPTEPVTQTDVAWIHPNMISTGFVGWNDPLSPAILAMSKLGSVDSTDTMVVCESGLNAIKSRLFRFFRPVSAAAWSSCCSATTKAQSEAAFSHLQRVFAVFDYYSDPNVRTKHKRAYDRVKAVLSQYEGTNGQVFHSQQLQNAWKEYNRAQANWVAAWARWWVLDTLREMNTAWAREYQQAKSAKDVQREYTAQQTINDINGFLVKAAAGHFSIDRSIFT